MKGIQPGFWKKVKEQSVSRGTAIAVLAPMANVTDPAFRQIIAKYGKPDVTWTEFVSADGLCSVNGREALVRDLAFDSSERPIVAQLFTSNPDKMRIAAALVQELGFDGLDINMGCPDRTIEKQCAGAAMMKDPEKAKAVIRAAKEGAPNIPVSVKTRIGYNKIEIGTWIPALLEEDIAVLTVHCRTRKEMSDVPARWEHIKEVIALRDKMQGTEAEATAAGRSRTLIFGNGDVRDLADAKQKADETGADGVMIGRAIFGNPWLFDPTRKPFLRATFRTDAPVGQMTGADGQPMTAEAIRDLQSAQTRTGAVSPESIRERLNVMLEHTFLFMKLLGDIKNFVIMKKHYKAYVSGWDGAKELRAKLMDTKSPEEVEVIVNEYLRTL